MEKKSINSYRILIVSLLIFTISYSVLFSLADPKPHSTIKTSASTTEKWGTIEVMGGEYIVQNNVWGADTLQEITVPDTSQTSFIVSISEHNQGSVASYPSIFKGAHWGTITAGWTSYRVSELSSASYSWSVDSYRPSGSYNVAAEAWFGPNMDTIDGYDGGCELMMWLDSQGMVPAGSQVGSFGNFQVWYSQTSWNYITYFQTGQNSGTFNVIDFMNDAISRGYLQSSWYYHDIEAGFEIMSGGEGLTLNSFSASVSTGHTNDPPTINQPSDISYTEGNSGNSITWIPTDNDPSTYTITRNGAQVQSGSWSSGNPININVDGLSQGNYTYTCSVSDQVGQTTTDTVIISVTPSTQFQNGDANHNSEVNIVDALLIAQYYVGSAPQPFYNDVADVNHDGSINIIDALLVAQYYVGLINELP